jgi:hypothetical protein
VAVPMDLDASRRDVMELNSPRIGMLDAIRDVHQKAVGPGVLQTDRRVVGRLSRDVLPTCRVGVDVQPAAVLRDEGDRFGSAATDTWTQCHSEGDGAGLAGVLSPDADNYSYQGASRSTVPIEKRLIAGKVEAAGIEPAQDFSRRGAARLVQCEPD